MSDARNRFPIHGWIGLILTAVFWMLNWTLPGIRTSWGFFPLWLGYCLTVDALVFLRKGSSMIARSLVKYVLLFVISAPAWWLFELLNIRSGNWSYQGRELFSSLQYAVFATVSFSTVMPAVFGTAELVSTFKWVGRIGRSRSFLKTGKAVVLVFLAGWVMLGAFLIWPGYFFPLLWSSVVFILEPVNVWFGNRSLREYTEAGDWRPLLSLGLGCLVCGFFWEMWNFYSFPRWVYNVPFVGFLHIFEMPVLGYGGYLPFSLELFAIYHLITGLFGSGGRGNFVQIRSEWSMGYEK